MELAFALEHGALRAAPDAAGQRPHAPPLLARHPLRFWQGLSAFLAALLLAALALRWQHG